MSTDQDKLIAELVEKGLTGDMEPINSIEDRVLRSKAKAALVKAKRAAKSQERPDSQKKKSEEKSSDDLPPSVNLNKRIENMINEKFPGSPAHKNTEPHLQR